MYVSLAHVPSIILRWNNNLNCRHMQRFMGYLFIAVGVAGVVAQWLLGINKFVDQASRYIFGPNYSGTFGSPVGEAVIYMVFYFIAVAGLALMATSQRTRQE